MFYVCFKMYHNVLKVFHDVLLCLTRFVKSTRISMIRKSVTHLRSYSNTAIAGTPRRYRRAKRRCLRIDRQYRRIEWQVFECFMMFHNVLIVFHDVLLVVHDV